MPRFTSVGKWTSEKVWDPEVIRTWLPVVGLTSLLRVSDTQKGSLHWRFPKRVKTDILGAGERAQRIESALLFHVRSWAPSTQVRWFTTSYTTPGALVHPWPLYTDTHIHIINNKSFF